MKNNFYKIYSKYYDIINRNKNYKKEVSFIDSILKKYNVKNILDIGCGTCTHALMLAKKGYSITGIDLSEDMLKIAEKKIKGTGIKIKKMDMKKLNFKEKFDAITCMYYTMNHLETNKDILQAMKSANKCLKKDGIYIIDMSQKKIKADKTFLHFEDHYKSNNKELMVISSHKFDAKKQCQYTKWIYTIVDKGKSIFAISGTVITKAITTAEIKNLLKKSGFNILKMYSNYKINKKYDRKNRHITLVCQKV